MVQYAYTSCLLLIASQNWVSSKLVLASVSAYHLVFLHYCFFLATANRKLFISYKRIYTVLVHRSRLSNSLLSCWILFPFSPLSVVFCFYLPSHRSIFFRFFLFLLPRVLQLSWNQWLLLHALLGTVARTRLKITRPYCQSLNFNQSVQKTHYEDSERHTGRSVHGVRLHPAVPSRFYIDLAMRVLSRGGTTFFCSWSLNCCGAPLHIHTEDNCVFSFISFME